MKFDKEKIVQEVIKMRIKDLASTRTILEYIMEQTGVKDKQAYNYLADAQAQIIEMYKDIRITAFEEAIAQLQTLLEEAETVSDKLKVRQELSKIQGLYIEKIQHSGEITYKAKFDE